MTDPKRDLDDLLTAEARHRIAEAEAALDRGEGIPWEVVQADLADARRRRRVNRDRRR